MPLNMNSVIHFMDILNHSKGLCYLKLPPTRVPKNTMHLQVLLSTTYTRITHLVIACLSTHPSTRAAS